jgi:two-component system, LytTR family, sensor kinase
VPPLSLQVLIENAFTQNSMSRESPLRISIKSEGNSCLNICNSRRPKTVCESIDLESGLDNLVNRYRLLNALHVEIRDAVQERSITLPLIEKGGDA